MRVRSLSRLALLAALGATCACTYIPRTASVTGMPPDDRSSSFSAVWVGHATVLMRFGKTTVLTDPHLSDTILFYPRGVKASLKPRELPPIDVVLISHPHMDHLDVPTMKALHDRPTVFMPTDGTSYRDDIPQ